MDEKGPSVDAKAASGPMVAFVGLGAMGSGMAGILLSKGFQLRGYDPNETAMENLKSLGGTAASNPVEAAQGAHALVVMVATAQQADTVLFGHQGAASSLAAGAVVLLCSTVPPQYARDLPLRLAEAKHSLLFVDAPVSGGVARAANGTLTIMAAGAAPAVAAARPLLEAMSASLYIIGPEPGLGSSVKMVNQLLAGVHIAAAAEAMALGAKAGLPPRLLFRILASAAASSWMLTNRVPHMLDGDFTPLSALDIFVKDLGIVLGEAKALKFPLPLAAAAHQQFLMGSMAGLGRHDDSAVVKIWEKMGGATVAAPATSDATDAVGASLASAAALKSAPPPQGVAFIGLGAMGGGMAAALVGSGFSVTGFDVSEAALEKLRAAGGQTSGSPQEAAKGAEVLLLMVTTAEQAEAVLFGPSGAAPALAPGAAVVLCSTVPPDYVRSLEARLAGGGVLLVDAPVSGGSGRAAEGTLTIMAAGTDSALHKAGAVLTALSQDLFVIKGGPGAASSVKMVNQLLAGVHLAAAAEAMALGAKAGLSPRLLFRILGSAAASSWMLTNRVPHMLDDDFTPFSALDIFVKDLGIVLGEAQALKFPLPLAAAAHQQFLMASAAGLGRQDDAAVVKVFERMTGVTVAAPPEPVLAEAAAAPPGTSGGSPRNIKEPVLSLQEAMAALPPEWKGESQQAAGRRQAATLVVLDDDPTGTQTVHGVTVLTQWSEEVLRAELEKKPACFFILTNSRALPTDQAAALTLEICQAVAAAAAASAGGKASGEPTFTIVLRGDSTLRGHFPQEVEAAAAVVGDVDSVLLCPFFLQGGRYTIQDIHYVADGDQLVPAGQTEFARDATFGYSASNMRQWVEEKTRGKVRAGQVASISIESIRQGGPAVVCRELCALSKGAFCIVNAASDSDVRVFAAGVLLAEAEGKRFICRTAASFVSAMLNLETKPPLGPSDLGISQVLAGGTRGGLLVVGSYVPKTTAQVAELVRRRGEALTTITVGAELLSSEDDVQREREIARAAVAADVALMAANDTLVVTSRKLLSGPDGATSLAIGSRVSSGLVEIVRRIRSRPRYLLAKGGITSSDIATKAMGATRALVEGQALPGVPLWRLGPGSRLPGVPYIVFPGNVGGPGALADIVDRWAATPPATTLTILQAAVRGGYAVGAFNVYNLEGVQAVVAAAEAENSPALLQVHPSALTAGGPALVAACVAAARNASVPVAVHLDHATDEAALMASLPLGFQSVMADGSELTLSANVAFTRHICEAAHAHHVAVEAELGRLAGTEDGLTVEEYEARLTDVDQAGEFLRATGVDLLAVCIGNVHGKYPPSGPKLDLQRLQALQRVTDEHGALLVLHGASGLPPELVQACIAAGVRKFNVNTEVRSAYMKSVVEGGKDLLEVLQRTRLAMQAVVTEKLRLFGSAGKAHPAPAEP